MEKTSETPTVNYRVLPTFEEVLRRKSLPPVDLFMFYLFLQREGAENSLDFWLDIQQHENLCRAYFKGVLRSGKSVREDWPEYWDYARRQGSKYGRLVGLGAEGTPSRIGQTGRPMAETITREDLVESARRILARYIILGADKEVGIPPSLRTNVFPLPSHQLPSPTSPAYEYETAVHAQVPDMFHDQKEYIFRVMEQGAFPRFLRTIVFGNLTPLGARVRLGLGLLVLWIGLAFALSLIFLDVKPKSRRFYLFIPFTIAFLLLISHQYKLDPILVLLKQSEATPFRTLRIRDRHVWRVLLTRAVWVWFLVGVSSVVSTLVFWAIPGRRL